jgi:ApaG protein
MSGQNLPIKINVKTQYLQDRIDPQENKYAFAYRIDIRNLSDQKVKLLNRYWLITDGNGKKTEVQGEGVVGEQPLIEPGKSYQYTSGAILDTPVGRMQGHYELEDAGGNLFKAPIDIFGLAVPNSLN